MFKNPAFAAKEVRR